MHPEPHRQHFPAKKGLNKKRQSCSRLTAERFFILVANIFQGKTLCGGREILEGLKIR